MWLGQDDTAFRQGSVIWVDPRLIGERLDVIKRTYGVHVGDETVWKQKHRLVATYLVDVVHEYTQANA